MRTNSAALALLIGCTLALGGCSTTTLEPKLAAAPLLGFDMVDPAKVDAPQYERDYAQCATLANQDAVSLTRTAANALNTAADKATAGVLGGRAGKTADRHTVLKRCLTGRGYLVLR